MLRDGQIPTHKTAQAFAAIDSNGEVLTKLVDDLIDMSRVATGKLQLDRRPLDINQRRRYRRWYRSRIPSTCL
jgi:K+-sensing histidine kinase KdpD